MACVVELLFTYQRRLDTPNEQCTARYFALPDGWDLAWHRKIKRALPNLEHRIAELTSASIAQEAGIRINKHKINRTFIPKIYGNQPSFTVLLSSKKEKDIAEYAMIEAFRRVAKHTPIPLYRYNPSLKDVNVPDPDTIGNSAWDDNGDHILLKRIAELKDAAESTILSELHCQEDKKRINSVI